MFSILFVFVLPAVSSVCLLVFSILFVSILPAASSVSVCAFPFVCFCASMCLACLSVCLYLASSLAHIHALSDAISTFLPLPLPSSLCSLCRNRSSTVQYSGPRPHHRYSVDIMTTRTSHYAILTFRWQWDATQYTKAKLSTVGMAVAVAAAAAEWLCLNYEKALDLTLILKGMKLGIMNQEYYRT